MTNLKNDKNDKNEKSKNSVITVAYFYINPIPGR